MKTLSDWLTEYGQSHTHPSNKRLHQVCVPLIMFSLLGLLHWLSPWCVFFVMAAALVFYARLSLPAMWKIATVAVLMLLLVYLLSAYWWLFVGIFIIAWIGQFIGHRIEGKKPSFFKDLQFLLIGPLWVLNEFLGRDAENHANKER